MSNIYITMNGDNAVCTNPSEVLLASGSVGTHKVYFDISGYNEEYAGSGYEWGDLTLEAVFVASNAAYLLKENNSTIVRRSAPITKEEIVVDGLGTITQWVATVHEDVLKVPGKTLYIGLQGMKDSGEIARCSTLAPVKKIQPGADVDGPGDGDIPATRYESMKEEVDGIGAKVDNIDSDVADMKSTQSSHARQIIALNTAKTLFVPIYGDEINGYRTGRSKESIDAAIDGGAQVVAYVPCMTEYPYVGESDNSVWCYVPLDNVYDGLYMFSGFVYLEDYIPRYCWIELGNLPDGSFGVITAALKPFALTVNGNLPDVSGNIEIAAGGGITDTARNLLMTVLRNAVYTSDQSATLTALENALKESSSGSGGSGDSGGGDSGGSDEDESVVVQTGDTLYIVSGVTANQSGSILFIA